MRDEVLQSLIGARIAQPAVHRLHRLALAVVEQAVEIPAPGLPLRPPAETRAETVHELPQPSEQRPRRVRCRHARQRTDFRGSVQAPSLVMPRIKEKMNV